MKEPTTLRASKDAAADQGGTFLLKTDLDKLMKEYEEVNLHLIGFPPDWETILT